MPINLPRWLAEQFEADQRRFVPYAGHIAPNVIMNTDASVMAMLVLHGTSFELMAPSVRNARRDRLNTLLRTIGDVDTTISLHLVRYKGAPPAPQLKARSSFVQTLMDDYERIALTDLYTNRWIISVIVHPERRPGSRLLSWLPAGKAKPLYASDRQLRRLEDLVYLVESTLTEYQPRRLGSAEMPTDIDELTLPVTEMGSALHLIRTAVDQWIPHTFGPLSAAIYTEPVVFGPLAFDLNKPGLPRVGAVISFSNYPARPRVGMFNRLLSAPYCLVMTHIFRFKSSGGAVSAMRLIRQQMENAGDAATDLMAGLNEAANQTASLKTATGRHHFSLAVYADNRTELDGVVADASKTLSQFGGAAPTRELNLWYSGALETAYYAQLPGSPIFKPRPGDISTLDFADMASLDNFPTGQASGYWGRSFIRFKTNGLTAFDYISHDEDVGHTIGVGPNGRGKTVLLGLIAAALEPVMGNDGIRLVIDKDASNKLLIEACGGVHRAIRRNEPSGLAPLVALDDSPRSRAFLHGLYTFLIQFDGRRPLTSDEDARLARGIARQLKMPSDQRSMGGVREFLGYADAENGAGGRFERYCAGGSMGWLLDNREHLIDIGPGIFGFDFTDIIPREGQTDDGACTVAAAVIMHQLSGLMDGRRIAAFFDECRFYMEPLKRMIDDYTLTGRKKELMCWLVAQQPTHFTDSDIGMSLVAQCRTKIIFPDPNYDDDDLRKLKLSEPAIRQIRQDMTIGNARRFLLWRPGEPVIVEFDLTGLPQLSVLSGRPGTIGLMERLRADRPELPQGELLEEFYQRLETTRRAA
jgi:type IV secretion system protein VirB4